MRERINDLAAQVTAVTAALEGPESPINRELSKAANSANASSGSASGLDKAVDEVTSLADRIRALQHDDARQEPQGS